MNSIEAKNLTKKYKDKTVVLKNKRQVDEFIRKFR